MVGVGTFLLARDWRWCAASISTALQSPIVFCDFASLLGGILRGMGWEMPPERNKRSHLPLARELVAPTAHAAGRPLHGGRAPRAPRRRANNHQGGRARQAGPLPIVPRPPPNHTVRPHISRMRFSASRRLENVRLPLSRLPQPPDSLSYCKKDGIRPHSRSEAWETAARVSDHMLAAARKSQRRSANPASAIGIQRPAGKRTAAASLTRSSASPKRPNSCNARACRGLPRRFQNPCEAFPTPNRLHRIPTALGKAGSLHPSLLSAREFLHRLFEQDFGGAYVAQSNSAHRPVDISHPIARKSLSNPLRSWPAASAISPRRSATKACPPAKKGSRG